jgi:methionyl-tRNA formyltransferase
LTSSLAEAGAALLRRQIEPFVQGRLRPMPQDARGVTLAPELLKDDGWIDWRRDAAVLERQVRALLGWPGAVTTLHGARLKLHRARVVDSPAVAPPGTVVQADMKHGVHVACGSGTLELVRVQLAGKGSTEATMLVQGRQLHRGTRLGTETREELP